MRRAVLLGILFFLCSNNAFAQYDEQINFRSLPEFLTYNILFGDVYRANEEVFKGIVKRVKVRDVSANEVTEVISVNEGGKIISSKSNKGTYDIKAEYDIKNNLGGIKFANPDGKITDDIRFIYVGNTLLSYEYYELHELLEACTMRYDDAENKGRLTGFESHLWRGDSIPFSMNFKYDEKGRLYDVRITGDNVYYYGIEYSGDTVRVNRGDNSGYEVYVVQDKKIVYHKIHSEALSFTGERDFEYDERGLITKVNFHNNRGTKYFFKYEYDYWH